MNHVIPFPVTPQKKNRTVHFNRPELLALLDLYTKQVMAGQWRDYAINNGAGMAQFCIFKSAYEFPLYTIVKMLKGGKGAGSTGAIPQYHLFKGREQIKKSDSLPAVLATLQRRIKKPTAVD